MVKDGQARLLKASPLSDGQVFQGLNPYAALSPFPFIPTLHPPLATLPMAIQPTEALRDPFNSALVKLRHALCLPQPARHQPPHPGWPIWAAEGLKGGGAQGSRHRHGVHVQGPGGRHCERCGHARVWRACLCMRTCVCVCACLCTCCMRGCMLVRTCARECTWLQTSRGIHLKTRASRCTCACLFCMYCMFESKCVMVAMHVCVCVPPRACTLHCACVCFAQCFAPHRSAWLCTTMQTCSGRPVRCRACAEQTWTSFLDRHARPAQLCVAEPAVGGLSDAVDAHVLCIPGRLSYVAVNDAELRPHIYALLHQQGLLPSGTPAATAARIWVRVRTNRGRGGAGSAGSMRK